MTPASMPAQLGRYRLLRPLGQGGMGAVWVALDTRLQREVALKMPLVNAEVNPVVIERFQREARLAASIDHPNFCPVHDVGDEQGFHFYVMPIIAGRPLSEYLRGGQPWPLERAAHLILSLASALAELHTRGIIHRDLKPANVMVKPDGNVVLMDFGLARTFEGSSEGLTGTGQSLGTPSYMAPEQAMSEGDNVGPAADAWALGVMLYQLLTGRLPFTGTGGEVFGRILHLQPPPPSEHRVDKDTRLDALCLQALSKEPGKRPESMQALAVILGEFLGVPVPTTTMRIPGNPANGERGSDALFDLPTNLPRASGERLGGGVRPRREGSAPTEHLPDAPEKRTPTRGSNRIPWLIVAGLAGILVVVGLVQMGKEPVATTSGTQIAATSSASTAATATDKPLDPKAKDKDGPKDKPPDPKVKLEEGKSFKNSVGMEMVWIKEGTFTMGSPDSDKKAGDDEKPQHRVTIKRGFWMGSKEVTVGLFKEFARESNHKKEAWKPEFPDQTDEHPVVRVSWNEAMAFCAWLSKREQVTYDLPTEAEWEYCCRAGTTTRYSFGDDAKDLGKYAWYEDNSERRTHPVAQKQANPWGLYDMYRNAWEWCKDSKRTYTKDDVTDSFTGHSGEDRVLRGGAWLVGTRFCCSAGRFDYGAGSRWDFSGFRVVVLSSPRTP